MTSINFKIGESFASFGRAIYPHIPQNELEILRYVSPDRVQVRRIRDSATFYAFASQLSLIPHKG